MISLSTLIFAAVAAQATGPLGSIPAKYLPPKPPAAKVVATVNGQPVTVADVDSLLWNWRVSQSVLDEIINYLLVKTEAKKESVRVTPEQVDAELNKQIQLYSRQLPPGANVDQALQQQGYFRSKLYMGVETHLLMKSMLLKKFDATQNVKVSTVLVKEKTQQAADVTDAGNKAQEAYGQLIAGKPWETVLKDFAGDPNAVQMKGLLGWRPLSVFPPTTQQEFKTLKVGGYTKPVQTQYGFQIFRLDMLGKDAKASDLDKLKDDYVMANQPILLAQLKKAAVIVRAK